MSTRRAVAYGAVWIGTQALWLSEAYKLEFLGQNVFFGLWIRGVDLRHWELLGSRRDHGRIRSLSISARYVCFDSVTQQIIQSVVQMDEFFCPVALDRRCSPWRSSVLHTCSSFWSIISFVKLSAPSRTSMTLLTSA